MYPFSAVSAIERVQQLAPPSLLEELPELTQRFTRQLEAVQTNSAFLRGFMESLGYLRKDFDTSSIGKASEQLCNPQYDIWVHGLLTQLRREWSDEAAAEREASMGKTIEALERHLPAVAGAPPPKVVVPGAGLCRHVWELSLRGYSVLGVERAIMFLDVFRYLHATLLPAECSVAICPHAHEFSGPTNVSDAAHLSRRYQVPGLKAIEAHKERGVEACEAAGKAPPPPFTVLAGSFADVAADTRQAGSCDACITCFYLDASGDILGSFSAISTLLRPGGIWVNLGPLEYDGAEGEHSRDGPQLRLCADELFLLIQRRGFELLEQAMEPAVAYTTDELSMYCPSFRCCSFVARKL